MHPTVSVIIPTYNRASLAGRAIRSVLAQTFSDFEILVVDDASSEDTHAVIERHFNDRRIRHLRLPQNVGPGEARNQGAKAANGSYLAFLDSDDEWLPNKLEAQIRAVKGVPGPVLCFSKYIYSFDGGAKFLPGRGIRLKEDVGEYLYCSSGTIQTSTVFMSRKAWRPGPFSREIGEDIGMVLDVCRAGASLLYVEEPLSIYHAEARHDKMSQGCNAEDLLALRGRLGPRLTRRAARGFMATIVAPNILAQGRLRDRLRAGTMIVKTIVSGGLSRRGAVNLIALLLLPHSIHLAVQRWKARYQGVDRVVES